MPKPKVRPVMSWSNKGPWDSFRFADYVPMGDVLPVFVWLCAVGGTATDVRAEIAWRNTGGWQKACRVFVPVLPENAPVNACSVPLLDLPPGKPAYAVRIKRFLGWKKWVFDASLKCLFS